MSFFLDFVAIFATGAMCMYIYLGRPRKSGSLPLPPGPPKLPIFGNFFDMPTEFGWLTYSKWSRKYNSDIIHVDAGGTSVIVISSTEIANELLERRSTLYSDRPASTMVTELMGFDWLLGFIPYGEFWRLNRRLFHQEFHPSAAMRFRPLELKAAHSLLRSLLDFPTDFSAHIRYMSGKVVLSIAYGITVQDKDDPYIALVEAANGPLVAAATPGAFYVDFLPLLKYVPEWFPGAGFKRKAKEWKRLGREMSEKPFNDAKENYINGIAVPSFVSYCLEKISGMQDKDYQEYAIRGTAGSMYSAGSETTAVALETFLLAMLKYPDVQAKAQKEIDDVVGKNRLPDFSHVNCLPYVSSVVKEVLRWKPIVPLAIPHLLAVDDIYKGWLLPAGSVIIPNTWAMLYNKKDYKDPSTFNPDRYLKDGREDPSVKDPAKPSFGFGRRVCPGRYMAMSSIWISVASILACFNIVKAIDENGNIIEPSEEYTSGLTSSPKPFKASFQPRSREIEVLLRSTAFDI